MKSKNISIKISEIHVTRKRQSGAVLAEFIIVTSLVLAPLFFGIPLIGKYVDNKQKLEQSARYSAWERTVWYKKLPKTLKSLGGINTVKSADKIGFEVQNRIFSQKDTGIYLAQNDAKTVEKVDPISNLYWRKGAKTQKSIYKMKKKGKKETKSFITATENEVQAPGMAAKTLKPFFNLLGKVSSLDLNVGGAYTSTVSMTLEPPILFDKVFDKKIEINRSNTIMADGWNAAGAAHAKKQVKGTVILDLFDTKVINTVRNGLAWTPVAEEVHSNKLIFGHVVVDAVPKVRLAKYKKK